MTPVIFRPAAAADIEDAYVWYERRRQGLGDEFLLAVQSAQLVLSERPEAFPALHRQTRRALLKRFPYSLYYRIYAERIVIVACMHARRDPKRWQRRR